MRVTIQNVSETARSIEKDRKNRELIYLKKKLKRMHERLDIDYKQVYLKPYLKIH